MNRLTIKLPAIKKIQQLDYKYKVDFFGGYIEENRKQNEIWLYHKSIDKLAEYENLGLAPKEIEQLKQQLAEKEELLKGAVVLPCKIGDKIYIVPSKVNYDINNVNKRPEYNKVYEQVVDYIHFYGNDKYLVFTFRGLEKHSFKYHDGLDTFFNETWFLTKEEAQKKLEELNNAKM